MLRFDSRVVLFGHLADHFVDACCVARMARFGVRSGSLERSLNAVIRLNEAV